MAVSTKPTHQLLPDEWKARNGPSSEILFRLNPLNAAEWIHGSLCLSYFVGRRKTLIKNAIKLPLLKIAVQTRDIAVQNAYSL